MDASTAVAGGTAADEGTAVDGDRGGGRPVRLGVLATHPIQYHAPLYRALTRRGRVDLDVAFLSTAGLRPYRDPGFGVDVSWDVDLVGGFRHRFLSQDAGQRLTPRLAARLGAWVRGCDVIVVHGYRSPAMLAAAAAARATGVPYLARAEARPAGAATGWRGAARDAVAHAWVRGCAGALPIGSANRAFYDRFGAPRQFFAPYSVDNDRFAAGAAIARADRAARLTALGLPTDRPVVVLAAKLIEHKRPLDVVDAVRALGGQVSLLVIGDGPLGGAVRAACAHLPAACVGFVNQVEIPAMYGLGDILALPSSHEPWGLVVNEAMAGGLLPVVSDSVGCAPDLVEGVGHVFPTGDVRALASCLTQAAAEVSAPGRAERVRARVDRHSIDATARGYETAAAVHP